MRQVTQTLDILFVPYQLLLALETLVYKEPKFKNEKV